jgi:hypothetical protein
VISCTTIAAAMLFLGIAMGFLGSLFLWWVLDLLGQR